MYPNSAQPCRQLVLVLMLDAGAGVLMLV